ncbi:MAG: glycosyltransferase [Desulfurococcaceae archaeon]
MKFGLILCTYRRDYFYIKSFINSLLSNKYEKWELIIVDQNEDDSIEKNLKNDFLYFMQNKKIKYYKVDFKGLSKSRNYGLKFLSDDVDIVAFPDDDCEYPENLLKKVLEKFEKEKDLDFITGISIDKNLNIVSNGKFLSKDSLINFRNIWLAGISYTIFVRKYIIDDLQSKREVFDERLGVGSGTIFGSGEETDFLFILLKMGKRGKYFTDIVVYHPIKDTDRKRNISYSAGLGAVLRKNFFWHPSVIGLLVRYLLIRPIGGILLGVLYLDFEKVKFYFDTLIYRWIGFIKWKDEI